VLEYYYSSIDSLSNKAGHFLSFSMILDSLLGGYLGVLFLLLQERLIVANLVLNLLVYFAIFCLIAAIVCLLITGIIGVKCLNPKVVSIPIYANIDNMLTTERVFDSTEEWHLDHRQKLVDAIKENVRVTEKLQRNVRYMGILVTLSSIFFIGFILSTLVFGINNATPLNANSTNSTNLVR
jgi:hypothetical protein